MKTAVEWLFEQVWVTPISELPKILKEAKEMEKQQIKNSWIDGRFDWGKHFDEAEQYYNETYKSDGETQDTHTTV